MKHINKMTRKEFDEVPSIKNKEIRFDSLVVIPTGIDADSGYMQMDFVACIDKKPIGKFKADDLIEFNGTGGYGYGWGEKIPKAIPPVRWRIHCLMISGLIEIYANDKKELFATEDFGFRLFSNKV